MKERARMDRFHRRWNIPLDAPPTPNDVKQLATRISLAFTHSASSLKLDAETLSSEFSFRCGIMLHGGGFPGARPNHLAYISGVLAASPTLEKLFLYTQHLFWALSDLEVPDIAPLAGEVNRALGLMPSAGARLSPYDGAYELFPQGAPLLDEQVVDPVLEWIAPYAQSASAFHKALTLFQAGNPSEYRHVSDNLRFSLESLLRQVLNNEQPLEGQKARLSTWLNQKQLHQQLVNMTATVLDNLALYNNEWAKHPGNHVPSRPEAEFLIYQTATLMRLVLELHRST